MMKINADVYQKIVSCTPVLPPETGGILGGQDGIITHYLADPGNSPYPARYYPDTIRLNRMILQWQAQQIEFYGIYHSHYARDNVLSDVDTQYIKKIMQTMPNPVDKLYFPLIFPQKSMISYLASKENQLIHITCELIEII